MQETLESVLERVRTCTENATERTPFERLANLIEETGELSTALLVEAGQKLKPLPESSLSESVDVTICALAMFYKLGGTKELLAHIMSYKVDKWERNMRKLREQNNQSSPNS